MKNILCLIALVLLTGCGNNAIMKNIHENTKLYENLGNTKRVLTKDAIIYIQYTNNKKMKIFTIDINSKERDKEIEITNCKINGKTATVELSNAKTVSNIDWTESYTVSLTKDKNIKSVIACSLNNGEKFKESF